MFTRVSLQAAEQLRRALQLYAGTLPEEQALEVAMVYPAYETGRAYAAGQYITHGTDANGDPKLYRVEQGHTSAAEWPPEEAPALYTRIGLSSSGWPVWSPPTGAQDAYDTGDIVSHRGTLYKSKIDGNTTEPGADDRWWEIYVEVWSMSENCSDCPVNARVDSLAKEFDRYRDGSGKTHKEMFERINALEQAKTSLETKLDSIDAQLKKLVDYMETEKDKPNKLLDKLKENSIWLVLAAVLGMVLARWGL